MLSNQISMIDLTLSNQNGQFDLAQTIEYT
jgi:hypothetical protein